MSLMSLSRVNTSIVRTLSSCRVLLSSEKGCGISEKQAEILKQKTPIGETFFINYNQQFGIFDVCRKAGGAAKQTSRPGEGPSARVPWRCQSQDWRGGRTKGSRANKIRGLGEEGPGDGLLETREDGKLGIVQAVYFLSYEISTPKNLDNSFNFNLIKLFYVLFLFF